MPSGHHADDGAQATLICARPNVCRRMSPPDDHRIVAIEIDGQQRKKDHSPMSASISRSIVRLPRAIVQSTAAKMPTATAISNAT